MNKPVVEKKPVKKLYWTKSRKKQYKYCKILFWIFMGAVLGIGLFGTNTVSYIGKMAVIQTVKAESEPVPEVLPETLEQMVERVAVEEDFEWVSYMKRLITCESNWDIYAVNGNGAYGVDRGIVQWNSYFHPEITNEMAFNPEVAVREAMKLIQKGQQKQWVCDSKI